MIKPAQMTDIVPDKSRKHRGKRKIARNKQFLLFPQCFHLKQVIEPPFVHEYFCNHIFILYPIVGKGEKWWFPALSPFLTLFSKGFFSRVIKT